jgi:hypothetical protein
MNDFRLRLTITPYIGDLIILGAVSLLGVAALLRSHQPAILGIVLLLWLTLASDFYQKTRYRITWQSNSIRRVTANNLSTTIPVGKIARIREETARLPINLMRPSRRLTIYATDGEHIDVSLKHFAAADIRRLMKNIHEIRPDLDIPKQWLA